MKIFILYPNQLFKNLANFKDKKVLLIEEPLFFTQYEFHIQKLVLHRASMKFYESYLLKNNITDFKNIEINISAPIEEKNILELLKNCEMNSTIIVSNLNVFGRTIETILEIVKFLLSNKIRIIVVEQNLDLIDDKDMLTQMILGVISMAIGLEKEWHSCV